MGREDVIGLLGRPQKQEVHGTTEFLFYLTNWLMTEPASQRSPVAISDGKVVGLGKAYYETFVKAQTSKESWKGEVNTSTETERSKP